MAHKLDFAARIAESRPAGLRARAVATLLLNVGRRCDLACAHCHHECSPDATESMERDVMLAALELASLFGRPLLDVTGGAPELWGHLPELVERAEARSLPVRLRTNLTALARPDASCDAAFLAEHRVGLLASLPGTTGPEVAAQRGSHAYEGSLAMLRELARLGYGTPGGPVLEIAYNPPLGELPSDECELEVAFAAALGPHGVRFGRVRAITNVPLGRMATRMRRDGTADAYVDGLADAFNARTIDELACRDGVSVAWDGRLYDCDFNLAARLGVADGPRDVFEALDDPDGLVRRRLAFAPHCFACTAGGAGSG